MEHTKQLKACIWYGSYLDGTIRLYNTDDRNVFFYTFQNAEFTIEKEFKVLCGTEKDAVLWVLANILEQWNEASLMVWKQQVAHGYEPIYHS